MPNKIDYKTRIVFFYMLICKDVKVLNTYAGNTVSWKERKYLHKSDCNNVNSPKYNYKVYQIIRANGGFSNWSMIEIHKQLCTDKRDAERIEQSFITKYKCDMNTNNAIIPRENNKTNENHKIHTRIKKIMTIKIPYKNNANH